MLPGGSLIRFCEMRLGEPPTKACLLVFRRLVESGESGTRELRLRWLPAAASARSALSGCVSISAVGAGSRGGSFGCVLSVLFAWLFACGCNPASARAVLSLSLCVCVLDV